MGWDELLDITPGMFNALVQRHKYRDAMWIATYANMKRGKDQAPITPEELMGKRPKQTGMGPEVFQSFEKAFTEFDG
jgi:hypothetical protein